MPTSVYNKLEEMFSSDFMWLVNKRFLETQIGKDVYFTANPETFIEGTARYNEYNFLCSLNVYKDVTFDATKNLWKMVYIGG